MSFIIFLFLSQWTGVSEQIQQYSKYNFFKQQGNSFNAKLQESKYKTDIRGTILSGAETEKPTNTASSHLSPSSVASKSPRRMPSG